MKYAAKITGLFFATTICLSVIVAQEAKTKSETLKIKQTDERFALKNVSFYKRVENTFMSLNVNFELHNNTPDDIKLKVFIVAYRQIDSVDEELRKWIEYPAWRKVDIDKENTKNILLDSNPEVDKNQIDASIKDPKVYPEFQKYLQYLNANVVGTDIIIKGMNTGPSQNTGTASDMFIVTQSMKTSVYGRLKVKYNPGNLFFNNFGIVIIDPEQKKIVASNLYSFSGKFKTY
ncbi:MAG: hypothetical protein OEV66_05750 [Spirochaetia bacterium]|nr:hypothetical protein [Spirochaetia bacterium]